jgi:hypothetical protein
MPRFDAAKFQGAASGCLAKPMLGQFLASDASFDMTLRTAKSVQRKPDGWFHASAHPGLSEDELVAYLTASQQPEPPEPEEMGYVGRLSTMFGTIMHEVSRLAFIKLGIAVPVPRAMCLACGLSQPYNCREHGAVHVATRARCHLDGIHNYGGPPAGDAFDSEYIYGYDLKTIKPMIISKAPDMDEEFFFQRWPHYWWQMQECMRLTGLRQYIVLFMAMGNPWEMREYHVTWSAAASRQIEQKYAAALQRAGMAA